MNAYNYSIKSSWRNRIEKPAALGVRFLETLDELTATHPVFAPWTITDAAAQKAISLTTARKKMTTIVENNVKWDDVGIDRDAGYHLRATNNPLITPKSVGFTVNAGGKYGCNTRLEFGASDAPADLSNITYTIFKPALLTVIGKWPADWACAQLFKLYYHQAPSAPGIPPMPHTLYHIPWMAYLSARLSKEVDLPPDILTERTPDGGLLMIATEERLDPTNPEHMRRSRILVDLMIERAGNN